MTLRARLLFRSEASSEELFPEELSGHGEDHADENDADEGCSVANRHARAEASAEKLSCDHDRGDIETHEAGGQENEERGGVAGEIRDLGVGDLAGQLHSAQGDAGERPENPGARAEKAVVES